MVPTTRSDCTETDVGLTTPDLAGGALLLEGHPALLPLRID